MRPCNFADPAAPYAAPAGLSQAKGLRLATYYHIYYIYYMLGRGSPRHAPTAKGATATGREAVPRLDEVQRGGRRCCRVGACECI